MKDDFNKSFTWLGLDNEIRIDIVNTIYNNSLFLKKDYNIYTFKNLLDDSYELPQFEIVYKNINSLLEVIEENNLHTISNTNLNIYKSSNLILLYNEKVYDGWYRLITYKEMGMEHIPTIDITKMLDMDWEKWLNNEIDF